MEEGFSLVWLENSEVLISDDDILSYNWTSQEITISDVASKRLIAMGDGLYSFSSGFVIRINRGEAYRGVFRNSFMSAIPGSPEISIMFPSTLFCSEAENRHAMRMFYPWFEPPADQPEKGAILFEYFKDTGKLGY